MQNLREELAAPRRLKQLQMRSILDSPEEEEFDRLTRLLAKSISVPIALLTFVDGQRQWFKSHHGLGNPWAELRETPLSHSFCQFVVAGRQTLVINDARSDPLVRENLAIPEMGVAAYLGAPLIDSDGSVLGSLAAIDVLPRSWRADEISIVEDFATIAIREVQLRSEVTRRNNAEERLRQSQKLEAIGRLAGGVAHDLNNVLLIIQGYSQLLHDDTDPTDVRSNYIDEVLKAAERAGAVMRQLLAFSRKQVVQMKRVDLNAVIAELRPMLSRAVGEAITLEFNLCPELGWVTADPSQMEQIILNLVLNARDATTPPGKIELRTSNCGASGGPPVTPQLNKEVVNGDWVELQVIDFGSGIEREVLEHLFEPFYTTKAVGCGTGLGLATVYGIVQQSGGHIWAESEPGKGSIFHLMLPVARNETSMSAKPQSEQRSSRSRTCSILLVEDDESVARLLATILERFGHHVLSARSPQHGLEIVERSASLSIDLALVDVVMPGMSGRELGEELQKRRPQLKVIYMSGYTNDEVLRHGVQYENVRFIDKPIAAEQLLAAVSAALED
jgi:two-component system, cell cycle sensor histidine kinase and response regulator CckA